MRDSGGDLARYSEIAIVLGGGLYDDGRPTRSTLARADAAAQLAKTRDIALIVSGSHGDGAKPKRTEAALMADRIVELGIPPARIFLEEESRDTASNAAFVAERYLSKLEPRRLIIVTSPFHMGRSLITFGLVLGPSWPLEAHPSAPGSKEAKHAETEALYLQHTRARLRGIEPGDLARIGAQLRATMHENVSDEPRRPRPV
jgi:uncharacterized SAM-binding protein YcdF (DUF218 family)